LYSFLIGSPFLQVETLTPCRRAGPDDSEVLSSFHMHDDEDVARGRETNEQKPHLDAAAVRIVEDTRFRAYGATVPEEMLAGREDLTHIPLPTIDPEDARDHDDAVWVAWTDRAATSCGSRSPT
jgi:hypothetical protein